MVRRPQEPESRWSIRTWLTIATGIVAGLALMSTFSPAIRAAAQYVFSDSDQLGPSDIAALKQVPLGKELVARGLTPLYKTPKNGDAQWSVPCGSIDADDCIKAVVVSGNRFIYTSYTRNWRGEITSMRLTQASWFVGQTGQPGVAVRTPVAFCNVLPGATLNDLFANQLPNVKYCR